MAGKMVLQLFIAKQEGVRGKVHPTTRSVHPPAPQEAREGREGVGRREGLQGLLGMAVRIL